MLGCLFIFIKVKNVNRFLSISLSFSAIVMMLISIFDLIPHSFFYLLLKYKLLGFLVTILIFLLGISLIKISNRIINRLEEKGSSLYKLGIISAIVLMLHNIPEDCSCYISR